MYLDDLPNYEDLKDILYAWEAKVYFKIVAELRNPRDIETCISIDSTGKSITIRHDVNNLESFDFMRDFCNVLNFPNLDYYFKADRFLKNSPVEAD